MADERVLLKVELEDESDGPGGVNVPSADNEDIQSRIPRSDGSDGAGSLGAILGTAAGAVGGGLGAAVGGLIGSSIGSSLSSLTDTIGNTDTAFQKLIGTTGDLVGEIAAARAQADLRLLRARIGIGRDVSDSLIRNLSARTDVQIAFEEFQAKLFQLVEPMSTAVLRILDWLLDSGVSVLAAIKELQGFLANPQLLRLFLVGAGFPAGIVDIIVRIAEKANRLLDRLLGERRGDGLDIEAELDRFFDPAFFTPP